MGRRYSGRNMGDPAVDLEKTIMPVACAGGIYDFSGTQANYVYAESGVSITQEEIQYLTKAWWDGKSDGWSSDEDFNALLGWGVQADPWWRELCRTQAQRVRRWRCMSLYHTQVEDTGQQEGCGGCTLRLHLLCWRLR